MGYGNMLYYAGQGIFIPLDNYDPLGYPRIKAAFERYPALNDISRGNDGHIYGLPQVNDCWHCTYADGRFYYYMPWMRDNNIKQPETLDEFTDYLRYVKTHDLNGNGKNDEIPLLFYNTDLGNVITFFARTFMPYVGGLAKNNGKIWEQYKDPAFRETLKYLAGIYKEGLMAPDSFTMTQDQATALSNEPLPRAAVSGTTWATFWTIPQPSVRSIQMFPVIALKGPTGQRNASNGSPYGIMGPTFFVTDKAKNPSLAVALYDYFLDHDVMMDGYLGPKGTAWEVPKPGVLSLSGTQAVHNPLVQWLNQPINSCWAQANPMIRSLEFRNGEPAIDTELFTKWFETGDPSLEQRVINSPAVSGEGPLYIQTLQQSKYEMSNDYFLPPLAMNDNDSARVSDINAVLSTYRDQAAVEFITGIRDINNNSQWTSYLADLDRLGSAELAQIYQKYIK
jgi:putative aldouronate transport system substrate-binding protein